jgi:hypothetical protein
MSIITYYEKAQLSLVLVISFLAYSYLSYKNNGYMIGDNIKSIFSVLFTLGIINLIGGGSQAFVGYIILLSIMYFYYSSDDIEITLLKSSILIMTLILVGWWRMSDKEGFSIFPAYKMPGKHTALECQNKCQNIVGCKYAQVPLGTSNSGNKTHCWTSCHQNGCKSNWFFGQTKYGKKNKGYDVWKNKKAKQIVRYSANMGSRFFYSRRGSKTVSEKKNLKFLGKTATLTAYSKDQGWGNPTWGTYLDGYDKNNKRVFRIVLKAPRSRWRYKRMTKTITINSNVPITRLKCFVYSRGWGHATYSKKISYYVSGFKV